jgi:hypothetical protein
VAFYDAKVGGTLLAEKTTSKALLPGETETISFEAALAEKAPPFAFHVEVDGTTAGMSSVDECLEDNNQSAVDGVTCPKLN